MGIGVRAKLAVAPAIVDHARQVFPRFGKKQVSLDLQPVAQIGDRVDLDFAEDLANVRFPLLQRGDGDLRQEDFGGFDEFAVLGGRAAGRGKHQEEDAEEPCGRSGQSSVHGLWE
jgi:hypothetical protein